LVGIWSAWTVKLDIETADYVNQLLISGDSIKENDQLIKKHCCTATEPGQYSATTLAASCPVIAQTHSNSYAISCRSLMMIGDSTSAAITIKPPLLVDRSSLVMRSQNWSTTLKL